MNIKTLTNKDTMELLVELEKYYNRMMSFGMYDQQAYAYNKNRCYVILYRTTIDTDIEKVAVEEFIQNKKELVKMYEDLTNIQNLATNDDDYLYLRLTTSEVNTLLSVFSKLKGVV